MQTIRTPDGQVFKFPTTMSRTQIAEALKRRLGNQTVQQPNVTPAKPTGDTSMGTAFKYGDASAVAATQAGSSVLNRQLENSAVGRFFRNAQETIGNPVRSLVGADPIDPNAVQNRLDKAADASSEYLEQLQKDLNFQNLETSDIKDLGSFVNYVGQKAAQAAPFMGAALASGGFLTAPFGVGEVDQSLDEIEGLDRQTQDNIATAGGLIMAALETLGIAKLLPKGTSNKILGGIAEGIITEGVTEGMQELVLIGSERAAGKQFSEGEILNRLKESAAAGAVVGGSFKGGLTTGAKVKSLFTSDGNIKSTDDLSNLPESEKFAAADVARLIDETSKANGYKLKNVDPSSSRGAKQALEDVRSSNVQAINDLKKVLSKRLDPKNAQSLEQLLSVYSEASAGIGAGKKKVSQKVTEKQIEAIQQLVGNTKEGQQLVQELVKSNVITDLFKGGMKGGISQFTDLFNPISHSGAVYDPTRYANVFVGGASAYGTGGVSLGIAAGGRVVDFFTGRRSKVSNFVKKNRKALGLPAPEGTSLIEQKAKQKAAAKDRRAAIAQIATILDAPKAGFVENILLGTGLDRSGLETVLNNMASDFGSNPDFVAILDDIQTNLDGEGVAYLDNLSEIIPVIGAYAQAYSPELVTNTPDNPLLKRSFDSPNVQTDMPTMGGGGSQFGAQFTTPENYRRGIRDNLDFVRTLQDGAGKDKNLSRVDRGRLITSLENLKNNLGSNPVDTVQTEVQKLQDQGVNQDAIDKYVQPYVDRVVRQQRPKGLQEPVRFQMGLPLFNNPLPIDGKPTVKKIGEAMNDDHMAKVGRKLFPEENEADFNTVLDYARQEMAEQLKQPNSGVGWYSKDVDDAMKMASRVYPTLATDQQHRQLYLTFAGIFSNGTDPDNAFMMSSMAFDDFLRTGEIPTNRAQGFYDQGLEPPKTTFKSAKTGKMVTKDAGWGIRNQANEQQLGLLKYLVETKGGLKSAMDFLLTPQKRTDINDVMLDSGLYKAGRFTTKKEKEGEDEYGFLAFGKKLGRYSLGLHGVDVDAGDTTIDLWYTRSYRRWTGRLLDTPIGKEGVAAMPANDQERDAIFRLTGDLVKENPDLTVGDVQALLWFFEKRTWGSQGLNTKEGTNSSGARKLLQERGIDPDQNDDGARSDGSSPQPSPAPQQPRLSDGILARLTSAARGRQGRPTPDRTIPSNSEFKQQTELAGAPFQIGKKGSKYENGIKDFDDIRRLADAYNITLIAFDNHAKMREGVANAGESTAGLFNPKTRTAKYLVAGTKMDDGTVVDANSAFISALHEVTHGIAGVQPDGSLSGQFGNYSLDLPKIRKLNKINNRRDPVSQGTFEAKIADLLNLDDAQKNDIIKEIINLQDFVNYRFSDGSRQRVRDLQFSKKQAAIGRGRNTKEVNDLIDTIIRNHENYVRDVYEISVDPVIYYLYDPKTFKSVAPKTAKMMRDFFNETGKIQFYNHPLALGVAVVLAMLLKQEQADEEDQQRGILAQRAMQAGALTA